MIDMVKKQKNIEILSHEEAFVQVKNEVQRSLTKSPLLIREYLSHLAFSQGKFIRTASLITCAEDNEGNIHPNAIKVAAAIELIHLSSLVHDDVIDNAELRRGKVTLQKKYGQRTAVICGDYLLSIALKMISNLSNKDDYMDMEITNDLGRLCMGELNQHINNNNFNLSMYQYLKIISGKTASLFELSFFAGAVILRCDEKVAKQYRQIGYYIGMIFQLSDDCIDFDSTVKEANKPVQSDFEQGVITLPLIHAFHVDHDFKDKVSNYGVNRQEINEVVSNTEGIKFTKIVIKKYYNKAMKRLNEIEMNESKKNQLMSILNQAARIN